MRISIHALREEGDYLVYKDTSKMDTFLSTPSARRATLWADGRVQGALISIHALREEGDWAAYAVGLTAIISIHALREEGDSFGNGKQEVPEYFYPRPPRGGRPTDNHG